MCGEYVCTTGQRTKAWSLRTGELLVEIDHPDIRVSSLVFKPSASADDEGKRVWLGTSIGEIHELDIPAQAVVAQWLESFKDYPIRQKPASFNLDDVMRKLTPSN